MNEATQRRGPSAWVIGFSLACFWTLLLRSGGHWGADSYWHLATGEWIWSHQAIPWSDPWSTTAGQVDWINVSWAYDLILYGVVSMGGYGLASVLSYGIIAATAGGLAWALERQGADPLSWFFGTSLFFVAMARSPAVRPLVLAYPFCLLAYLLIRRTQRFQPVHALAWAVFGAVWVNLHGSFLAVIPLFGAFGLQAIVRSEREKTVAIVTNGLAFFAGTLFNPWSWRLGPFLLGSVSIPITHYIEEWAPMSFLELNLSTASLGLIAASILYRRDHLPLSDGLIASFWVYQGMFSQRHLPLTTLFGTIVITGAVRQLVQQTRLSWAERPPHSMVFAKEPVGLIALLLVGSTGLTLFLRPTLGERIALSPVIQKLHTAYPDVRWFNDYGLGGLLIHKGPMIIFTDGRAQTAYPADVMSDRIAVMSNVATLTAILEKRTLNGVIGTSQGWPPVASQCGTSGWPWVAQGPQIFACVHESNGD